MNETVLKALSGHIQNNSSFWGDKTVIFLIPMETRFIMGDEYTLRFN